MIRFVLIVTIFLFLIFVLIKVRKRIIKIFSFHGKVNLGKARSSQKLSEFQEWLLVESGTSDPKALKGSAKEAFEKNEWNLLETSIYAKWSKFHWGI